MSSKNPRLAELQVTPAVSFIVSMVAMAIMAILFFKQTYEFMQVNKTSEVVIDANIQNINKVTITDGSSFS